MARILGNWKITHPTPKGPARMGRHEGLAYALWLPEDEPPSGGVVILHGAGSCKESHFDFARAARAAGMAAVTYDQRGHGESDGPMDGRMVDDVLAVARLLGEGPLALRGSSMGGYAALLAAARTRVAAVVAICPASADGLRRGLRAGRFDLEADEPALDAFLAEHSLDLVVPELRCALMLLHARGDEQVPVEHSIALHRIATTEVKKLVVLPGGHHRSIPHDPEMQAVSLRFIAKAFAAAT